MKTLRVVLVRIGFVMVAFLGIVIGKLVSHRPSPKETPAQKEATERKLVEQIMGKPSKEERRKYPRALPGGGLDWTGVEGGPR